MKYAQVSKSPRRWRSSLPVTAVRPSEPTTSASTIRGDLPRLVTLMPLKLPFTRPLSFLATEGHGQLDRAPAVLGETSSKGSSTLLSHGWGLAPRKAFSTFSVCPPEVEKK